MAAQRACKNSAQHSFEKPFFTTLEKPKNRLFLKRAQNQLFFDIPTYRPQKWSRTQQTGFWVVSTRKQRNKPAKTVQLNIFASLTSKWPIGLTSLFSLGSDCMSFQSRGDLSFELSSFNEL